MVPGFSVYLQSRYDLDQEQESLAKRPEKELKVLAAA